MELSFVLGKFKIAFILNQICQLLFSTKLSKNIVKIFRQYFQPNIPEIPGIETFPGTILHSHSYRKPEDFTNKSIVILGASSSGIDIGIELCAHANQVYLSHYGER